MRVMMTLDDLPSNEKNCATCTRGAGCHRNKGGAVPGGYIKNSVTGEVGGMVSCCPLYTGPYEMDFNNDYRG